MLKKLFSPVCGLVGLMFMSLLLMACGSDTSKETATTISPEVAATKEEVKPTAQVTDTQETSGTVKCEPVVIPENKAIAAVSAEDWSKGSVNASLTLIEYSDFQCPGCAGMSPVVDALVKDYGNQLRFVYRHFPLITIHDKAQITAESTEAAGAQGKFWEMYDVLFAKQAEWSSKPVTDMVTILVDYAKESGVADLKQFEADLTSHKYEAKIQAAYNMAEQANLSGTPSFAVNQVDYPSEGFGLSYRGLDVFLKLMKLRSEKWYAQPEQVIDPSKKYNATIKTEKGDIVVELYPDTAPLNVNSFAYLAKKGWYENLTFHRVLTGFMAQGGDPTGTGVGFPGYRCGDEVTPKHKFEGKGVVALANSGPGTNGGQFFITYAAAPNLNEGFTIIGQVIKGQEIADKLTPRDPQNSPDAPPGDKMLNIVVEEQK